MTVQTLVFELSSGARFRAGRTLRALRHAGLDVIDMSDGTPEDLAVLLSRQQPAWLVRAGAWPARSGPLVPLPSPSATGRAVCAVGVVCPQSGIMDPQCAAWAALREETGGDFSLARSLRERLPAVASVYLEGAAAGCLAQKLRDGADLGSALVAEIGSGRHRVIHFPALDIYDDPGQRVVQVVTSLHQGGAERVALNLRRELGRHGVRCLLATLGRPTRSTFVAPAGTIDLASRFSSREERSPRWPRWLAGSVRTSFTLTCWKGRKLPAWRAGGFRCL
jgi:hypothetical protein